MSEHDLDLTLEEAINEYGKTRGVAVYCTSLAYKELKNGEKGLEKLEGNIYDVLTDFIDE